MRAMVVVFGLAVRRSLVTFSPLVAITLLGLLWLVTVAATGEATQGLANVIAAAVVAVSPVGLKILNRYWPLDGPKMAAVSFITAALVALVASLGSGEFSTIDVHTIGGFLATAGWLWAVQQAVYHTFEKQLG